MYRNLFRSILDEERKFVATDDVYYDPYSTYPPFGESGSDLADVDSFYHMWETFSSHMSFSWTDTYDIRDVILSGCCL